MTPTRETIARVYVETVIGKPDPEWAAHWQWYLDGAGNPDSCVHYSNHGRGSQHADAVLRALDAAGLAVVPTDPASEARRGLEWFERTFGVPLGDMPGRLDVERVRAMIAAAPDVVE